MNKMYEIFKLYLDNKLIYFDKNNNEVIFDKDEYNKKSNIFIVTAHIDNNKLVFNNEYYEYYRYDINNNKIYISDEYPLIYENDYVLVKRNNKYNIVKFDKKKYDNPIRLNTFFFIDIEAKKEAKTIFEIIDIENFRIDENMCNIYTDSFINCNKLVLASYSINEKDNQYLLNRKKEYFSNIITMSYKNNVNSIFYNTSLGVIPIIYDDDTQKEFEDAQKRIDDIEYKIYPIDIKEYTGYDEGIYIKYEKFFNKIDVYYKNQNDDEFIKVDDKLIQEYSNNYVCNILGLTPGIYDIKLVNADNPDEFKYIDNIEVYSQDRSGYAHFNYHDGVGAYKDNGELKDDAVVIYVDNNTKNTVTYNGAKGLIPVINKVIEENKPLCVRVLDIIDTPQWFKIKDYGEAKSDERKNLIKEEIFDSSLDYWVQVDNTHYEMSETNIIKSGLNKLESYYKKIKGITNKILFNTETNEADTYFNMIEIKNGSNITIEGIGYNAGFYNCGLDIECCNSIEVKNLSFNCNPEDAVSIRGKNNNDNNYNYFWVHDCTFNQGKNNWDITFENDKVFGDGSTDFKYAKNLTISYCTYKNTNKTCLIGANLSSLQKNITIHHNYYDCCISRLPYARNSNLHIYNCYFNNCEKTIDLGTGSIALIEECLFNMCPDIMNTDGDNVLAKVINCYYNSSDNPGIYDRRDFGIFYGDVTKYIESLKLNHLNYENDIIEYYETNINKINIDNMITDRHMIRRFVPFASGNGKYDRKLDDIWFDDEDRVLLINKSNDYYVTESELHDIMKKSIENKEYNEKYYKILLNYLNEKLDTNDFKEYEKIVDIEYGFVNDEIINIIMSEEI